MTVQCSSPTHATVQALKRLWLLGVHPEQYHPFERHIAKGWVIISRDRTGQPLVIIASPTADWSTVKQELSLT